MATKKMVNPPLLARGSVEKFEEALNSENGIFKNITQCLWGYIKEGEHEGEMLFCAPDELDENGKHIWHLVKGNNPDYIQRFDELPDTGESEILYIVGNTIYTWNGLSFVPSYVDLQEPIENLTTELQALTEGHEQLVERVDEMSIQLNNVAAEVSDTYSKDETERVINQIVVESLEDVGSPITQSVTEVIEQTTYTKDEVNDKIGDIGTSDNVVDYVTNQFEMRFL